MLGAAFITYVSVVSLAVGFGSLEFVGRVRRVAVLAEAAGRGKRIAARTAPVAALGLLLATIFAQGPPGGPPLVPAAAAALLLCVPPAVWSGAGTGVPIVVGVGSAALLLVDRVAEGALLASPVSLPFPAPLHPASVWGATVWFLLHQLLAGGGTAGFLLAAAGAVSGDGGRARLLGASGAAAGLLFLVPQPVVGYYYCEELLRHYTPAWAMLMGGGTRHLWYDATSLAAALLAAALVGVAATCLFPRRGGRVVRVGVAAGLLLVAGGIAAALVYGGTIMVPAFTWEMGEAAILGLAAGLAVAAVSLRGLLLGLAGLSLATLALMGASWVQADTLLAYKNHLVDRPPAPVAVGRSRQIVQGEQLARFVGCFTCHGEAGSARRPNPGDPYQAVPAWNSPAFAATFGGGESGRQKLMTLLWEGQYAYRREYYPSGNDWSVRFHTFDNRYDVPAWNGILTKRQMGYLVTYIQSLIPARGKENSH